MGGEKSKEAPPKQDPKPTTGGSAAKADPKPAPANKPAGGGGNQGGAKKLKLVLVGDTSVGKSALITNYLYNTFTEVYEPTVLDVYEGVKNVAKKQVNLEIHDTSGDEHLGTNRQVQY